MAREILDALSDQRFQENVSREFDKTNSSGITVGCISGDKVEIAENVWRVSHALGVEPKGFIIIAQGSTTSIKAEMGNSKVDTVEIKFATNPTSFTLFLY
jgi:magnesium-transporting ATPase (P-type)